MVCDSADARLSVSIGIVSGGTSPSNRAVVEFLRAILKRSAELWGSAEDAVETAGCMVNVVFHVPGTLRSPDFVGIRTSTFSRKRRLLMVQVAVPDGFESSVGMVGFVFDALHSAVGVAVRYFNDEAMACGAGADLRGVLKQLRQEFEDLTVD